MLGVFDFVPRWRPLPWLLTEVTACAATGHEAVQFLYLAPESGGVVRVPLLPGPTGESLPPQTLQPAGVPARVTGLAVARLHQHVQAVYAVAGDEAVYRFSVDGVADQRIEWTPPVDSRRSAP
jgi:hypothetical protein